MPEPGLPSGRIAFGGIAFTLFARIVPIVCICIFRAAVGRFGAVIIRNFTVVVRCGRSRTVTAGSVIHSAGKLIFGSFDRPRLQSVLSVGNNGDNSRNRLFLG